MKTSLRLTIALTIAVAAFFATALGSEFLAWWWFTPSEPFADPATNALRFVAAALASAGSFGMVLRSRLTRALPPRAA